jgi:outer membrane protein assembly factor BamA
VSAARTAALLLLLAVRSPAALGERFMLHSATVDDTVSPARFLPSGALATGDSIDVEELTVEAKRIEQVLVDSGFLSARVEVETVRGDSGMDVRFALERGIRARILRWRLAGSAGLPQARLGRVLAKRTHYTRPLIDRAVRAARDVMTETGHPLAELAIPVVDESLGWVVPTLRIDAGPRPRVSFVAFSPEIGEARLLQRLGRFRPGPYSADRVRDLRRNIESYGLAVVESVELASRAADTGLLVHLRPQRSSEATGAAGYSVAERRFSGHARVILGNLFESGRSLSGSWQAGYGDTRYSLGYLEPAFLSSPVDLYLDVSHRSVDTSYAHTRGSITATFVGAVPVRVGLVAGTERIVDVDSRRRLDATWAGTALSYDQRDLAANPTRGLCLSVATQVGLRDADTLAVGLVQRSTADGEFALPLFGRMVGWSGIAARWVYSAADLLLPELNRMGGAGSLRGYRQDQFSARALGWLSVESRLVLGRLSRVYPFFDAGAYGRSDGSIGLFASWGIGARLAAGPGVLGVDYGVALDESPLSGKLHLDFRVVF